MYTTFNYKSKKALKADVAKLLNWRKDKEFNVSAKDGNWGEAQERALTRLERRLTPYQPGIGEVPVNGTCYLEGPHYPEPHRWYASATIKDGVVVKVS